MVLQYFNRFGVPTNIYLELRRPIEAIVSWYVLQAESSWQSDLLKVFRDNHLLRKTDKKYDKISYGKKIYPSVEYPSIPVGTPTDQ